MIAKKEFIDWYVETQEPIYRNTEDKLPLFRLMEASSLVVEDIKRNLPEILEGFYHKKRETVEINDSDTLCIEMMQSLRLKFLFSKQEQNI